MVLNYPGTDEAMAAIHGNYVPDAKQDIYQQGADVLFDLVTGLPLFVYRLASSFSRMETKQLIEHVPTETSKVEEVGLV